MEAEDKQPEVQPEVQVHVQDGPVVVEQVDSEVQGARIRQSVTPIQLRKEKGFEVKSPWERKLYRNMPAGLDLFSKIVLLY